MNELTRVTIYLLAGLTFVIGGAFISSKLSPEQPAQVQIIGIDKLIDKINILEDKNANLEQGRDYWKDSYWNLWCFEFEDDEEECYD